MCHVSAAAELRGPLWEWSMLFGGPGKAGRAHVHVHGGCLKRHGRRGSDTSGGSAETHRI